MICSTIPYDVCVYIMYQIQCVCCVCSTLVWCVYGTCVCVCVVVYMHDTRQQGVWCLCLYFILMLLVGCTDAIYLLFSLLFLHSLPSSPSPTQANQVLRYSDIKLRVYMIPCLDTFIPTFIQQHSEILYSKNLHTYVVCIVSTMR